MSERDDFRYDGQVTIGLALHGDEISVWPSNELKGGVAISLADSEEPRTNVGIASPPECDALIAAIGRALGRTPSDIARRALGVAMRIDSYDNMEPCTIAVEDAAEIAAILREVATREQGATVPRAGVARVLAIHAQIAETNLGEYRDGLIDLLLSELDKVRATLEAAGLWPLPPGPAKEQP